MKKSLSLLLCLVLLFTLSACVDVPPAADPVPVEPETNTLCAVLEGRRLYAFDTDSPAGGKLLVDEAVTGWDRRGDTVVAALEDHTVRRIDLTTGENEVLYTTARSADRVTICESGFVYSHSTMASSAVYYVNITTGAERMVFEDTWHYQVIGDTIYYYTYDPNADQPYLQAVDLPTGKEHWRRESGYPQELELYDGRLYVDEVRFLEDGSGDVREQFFIDPATGEQTPAAFSVVEESQAERNVDNYYIERYCDNGFFIREFLAGGGNEMAFLRADGTCFALPFASGTDRYTRLFDAGGDWLLFGSFISTDTVVLDEPVYYSLWEMSLFDAASGELIPLDYMGENAKLFADGDFPILDSSTARKPITRAIYSLFCLQSDAGGAQPVCNTTHGAWLALADKTSDIALLAAPTAEEQAYLDEKGVEVEMKLYGGDGLVFIANQASGVDDLTMDQVRAIYRGEVTNWSELGGVDAPITVLYRDSQSGSQRLFERMVWTDEPMPDLEALGFQKEEEMSTIVNMVVADPYAIGYSIMTYLTDVYQEPDLVALSLEGAAPTPENVASGSYPLGTKGYVVIRSDEPEDSPARRLYDWFGSPMSDQLLTQNGVTPLSE